jgi:uncharacterized protein (DUF2336 family)
LGTPRPPRSALRVRRNDRLERIVVDKKTSKALDAIAVERLLADPSAAVRADTAVKVAREFSQGSLNERERVVAEDVFRLFVRDVEVKVRESLANAVKECAQLPNDIAVALAKDVDQVALPMLSSSTVLTDEDLIEIIKEASGQKQKAIASRERVSASVSDALIERGDEEVVRTLVSNHGAEIAEASLNRIIDEFGESEAMQQPLAERPALPIGIAERLVNMVSERLQDHIMRNHPLRPALVTDLVIASRERTTVALLDQDTGEEDVMELVRQLYQNGRLTSSIILRAICMGDMRFGEAALATMANVPLVNAQTLIHDSGSLGFKAIYDKARLPKELYPAFRVAIDVVREMEYDGRENDRERFRQRAIERILTRYEDVDQEDLDYLLNKLTELGQALAPHAPKVADRP